MKKTLFAIGILVFCITLTNAQQLSIDDCQRMAKENYPLIKRFELIKKTEEYSLSNAGKGYLPQLSLNAKATYQSDVIQFPANMPGVKQLPQDQYSATIDLTQTIWDGGIISSQKQLTKSAAAVEQEQLEVTLYAIGEKINQLFFGTLLIDAQLEQNSLLLSTLQQSYEMVASMAENGLATQSDLDAVKVEQLNALQGKTQLQASRNAYLSMLSIFIGKELSPSTTLTKPNIQSVGILAATDINRPELRMFDAQIKHFENQNRLIKSGYMPKLGLFATAGYAQPALNMLNPNFDFFYIGGIKLSWNFGSLYTQKNERRKVRLNQDMVANQQETFLFNTQLEMSQEYVEIQKSKDLIQYDDEIVSLRESVRKATQAKLANGTSTTLDLVKVANDEDRARQEKVKHEVELMLAIYKLKFTTNK